MIICIGAGSGDAGYLPQRSAHLIRDADLASRARVCFDETTFISSQIAANLLTQGMSVARPVEVLENLTRDEAEWRTRGDMVNREFSDMSIALIRASSEMPSQIEAAQLSALAN